MGTSIYGGYNLPPTPGLNRVRQSLYREVVQGDIFKEQKVRFGLVGNNEQLMRDVFEFSGAK